MDERPLGSLEAASDAETFELGEKLGELVESGDVVGLVGELGAGKTRFAQGVARGLGVAASYRVTSPTFTLINEYPGRVELHHIDLYRLEDEDELIELGVLDGYGGDAVSLVEWFDRFASRPRHYMIVRFEITGEQSRRLELSGVGERPAKLASAWRAAARR